MLLVELVLSARFVGNGLQNKLFIPALTSRHSLHRNALVIVGRDFEDFAEHYLRTISDEEGDEAMDEETQEASQSFS